VNIIHVGQHLCPCDTDCIAIALDWSTYFWAYIFCCIFTTLFLLVFCLAYIAHNAMPKKISTQCNVFSSTSNIASASAFYPSRPQKNRKTIRIYTFENPQVRRSANPHFTGGRLPKSIALWLEGMILGYRNLVIYNLWKYYFTNRALNIWNSLPKHVVLSDTIVVVVVDLFYCLLSAEWSEWQQCRNVDSPSFDTEYKLCVYKQRCWSWIQRMWIQPKMLITCWETIDRQYTCLSLDYVRHLTLPACHPYGEASPTRPPWQCILLTDPLL